MERDPIFVELEEKLDQFDRDIANLSTRIRDLAKEVDRIEIEINQIFDAEKSNIAVYRALIAAMHVDYITMIGTTRIEYST